MDKRFRGANGDLRKVTSIKSEEMEADVLVVEIRASPVIKEIVMTPRDYLHAMASKAINMAAKMKKEMIIIVVIMRILRT